MIYHITERVNMQSIKQNGLIRQNSAFICLCEHFESWIDMFKNPVIFMVDINSFMKDNPSVNVTTWIPESDEICVWGDIPQRYIKIMDFIKLIANESS